MCQIQMKSKNLILVHIYFYFMQVSHPLKIIRSASAGSYIIKCEWCDGHVLLIHIESPEEIEFLDSAGVLLGV